VVDYTRIVVDEPLPQVRRVTMNRPDKRNALDNRLRGEIFHALEQADVEETVRVSIVRGAGSCFCAGYDLRQDVRAGQPYFTSPGEAQWPRHVVEGWFGIWDLAGTEIQALGFHQRSAKEYFKKLAGGPLTEALDARDGEFGDYRTAKDRGPAR
jgi:enoyl-CoA hydratase/carnithine racemase